MMKTKTQKTELVKGQEGSLQGELSSLAAIVVEEYFKRKAAERASKLSKQH